MGEVSGHTAVLGRWLERLREGDEAARHEVINHACQRLEALTRRMLRDYPRLRRWEQTDDVLQNAVLRLHRSLATVRPESAAQFYGLAAAQVRRELTDLARRIRESRPGWEEAARIVADVAGHLHYAHEMGLVHRDIKPANILLDANSRPVLADFGIAVTECEIRHETMTSIGTLAYMAPEQLSAGGQVDPRTDVYGLGVVLYELLTGTVPFADSSLTGLRKRILSKDAQPVRSLNNTVPPALEEICMKCLSRAAKSRYGSARELAQALTAFLMSQ